MRNGVDKLTEAGFELFQRVQVFYGISWADATIIGCSLNEAEELFVDVRILETDMRESLFSVKDIRVIPIEERKAAVERIMVNNGLKILKEYPIKDGILNCIQYWTTPLKTIRIVEILENGSVSVYQEAMGIKLKF